MWGGLYLEISARKININISEENINKLVLSEINKFNFSVGSYILNFLADKTDMFKIINRNEILTENEKIKTKTIISLDLEFWMFLGSRKLHKEIHILPPNPYSYCGGK